MRRSPNSEPLRGRTATNINVADPRHRGSRSVRALSRFGAKQELDIAGAALDRRGDDAAHIPAE
jgi:hypothetical protein